MQIFVNKADLAATTTPVLAFYEDSSPPMDATLHGPNATMLDLPPTVIDRTQTPMALVSNFRSANMGQMVNWEANRRVLLVFSEAMQRNATADINRSTLLYGADTTTWPSDAVARKNEGDRGWNYVNAVRQSSDALSTQTTLVDPTDDSHWPTAISPPIYIEPTP